MSSMRRLITIAEAARKKPAATAPQQSEAERSKAAIDHATGQAAALKARALIVAKEATSADHSLSRPFEQSWVTELRDVISTKLKRAQADAQERFELDREDDPNATRPVIDRLGCMDEALVEFWEAKKDGLDWSAPEYGLRRYSRANPNTELSDDITRLRDERDLLSKVHRSGGFGSLAEMTHTLDAISNWASSVRNTYGEGWSDPSETTSALVLSGIPAILFYCKLVAALSVEG